MIEAIIPDCYGVANTTTETINLGKIYEQSMQENDPVSHPGHYTFGTIETIDYIDSCGYGLDMCLGNAMKYVSRCKHKNKMVEDIKKAIWYLNHAVEKLESGEYKVV